MPYRKENLQALLPKVGDSLMKIPTMNKERGLKDPPPLPCKVEYVNRDHLWYQVRFNNGYTECYKVPELETKKTVGGFYR